MITGSVFGTSKGILSTSQLEVLLVLSIAVSSSVFLLVPNSSITDQETPQGILLIHGCRSFNRGFRRS